MTDRDLPLPPRRRLSLGISLTGALAEGVACLTLRAVMQEYAAWVENGGRDFLSPEVKRDAEDLTQDEPPDEAR